MENEINTKRIVGYNDRKILKYAQKSRGYTQADLANKLGVKQSAVSSRMTRDRMSLDIFRDILDALDYEVVIVDRKTGEPEWKVVVDK